ncbi:MAG: hypothetical protein V4529_16680 [Gemmatimonadota bacterium]
MGDFENLQVQFGALDTKMDPRTAPPGTLTIAENAQVQTQGVYKKRYGYTALLHNLSSIIRLATLGSMLIACDGNALYNYDAAGSPPFNGWHSVGRVPAASISQKSVILDQSVSAFVGYSTALSAGVRVDSWIDSTNGYVTIQLSNEATGALISRTLVDSTGVWNVVHSVTVGSFVFVAFSSNALQKINAVLINCSLETLSASTNIQTGAAVSAARAAFDMVAVSSTDVVLAWSSATPDVRAWRMNAITFASVAGPTVVGAEASNRGLAVMATEGEFGTVLYYNLALGVMRAACFNAATTAQTVAPFTVSAAAAPVNSNAGLVRYDATTVLAVWDWAANAPALPYVEWATVTSAGVVGTVRGPLYNHFLSSKPYTYASKFYVNAGYASAVGQQVSHFTVQLNDAVTSAFVPVAVHAYRSAGGSSPPMLSDVVASTTGVYRTLLTYAYKFLSTTTTRQGLISAETDFISPTRLLPVEANGDTLFANGAAVKYDGVNVSENNFHAYPEFISATPGAIGAAGMDNGVYSYVAVYESADAKGNTARSTTSVPIAATTTAGAGLGKVTLVTTQLNMTQLGWTSARQQGSISYFRTAPSTGAVTTHYYVGSSKIDPKSATATFVDSTNDSLIITERRLYTDGGILDREPPLPSKQMVLHQGRVWGISSADPKLVFYSGDVAPGEDVWFSNIQRFRVEPGGDLSAIASLDDKLVLFKDDRIFKVTGRGSNQLGQNNDLSLPQLISSDAGCVNPRSVVQTPDGIMFLSKKGIYLLNRSEQVSYIGAAVDYFTSNYQTCTSAEMVPDRLEIRFTMVDPVAPLVTPAGVTLVYDYSQDRWTHWALNDGAPAVDSVFADGVWHWTKADGHVYREDSTTYLDDGAYVPMTLETAWIEPSGSQGFARVNRVMVLGQWRDDHGLEVQVAKDYSDAYTMDFTWDAAALAALGLEQVAAHLPDQKGQSYRVRVHDYEDGASTGEGYWTTGILLKAKPIRGAFDKLLQAGAKA